MRKFRKSILLCLMAGLFLFVLCACGGQTEKTEEQTYPETTAVAEPQVPEENTLPAEDVYEGEMKDGKREGQGKVTYTNGDVYEGQWKNGLKEGQGKYTWADGRVYEGLFKNDKIAK